MKTYAYSPNTGELIATNTPADWMATTSLEPPEFNPQTHGCFYRNDSWVLVPAEVPEAPDYKALRASAYAAEADPLFFQEQRGEAEIGTWDAKVLEIKARYPKP